jgi:diguanylate cyclase (GGDEF)-like protein
MGQRPTLSSTTTSGSKAALPLNKPAKAEPAKDTISGFYFESDWSQMLEATLTRTAQAGEPCALICYQLDGAEHLRERLGNDATDRVVREMSTEIIDFIMEGVDQPGVLSQEQFGIVLPGTRLEKAHTLADQIRSYVASSLKVAGLDDKFTLSIGVAARSESLTSGPQVLDSARQALAKALAEGGNRCVRA